MRRSSRTLISLLMALSLLGGWTVQAAAACGGPCCAAEALAPESSGHGDGQAASVGAGCCCCGGAPEPCDLERGRAPDLPPRALIAAPKVERPLAAAAVATVTSAATGVVVGALRCRGTDPPGRAPPPPLYLYHLSLLC